MKIVIHCGMHKTGSSSIQYTFAGLNHPDLEYIKWGASGNHSALFVLLFEEAEKLADYHSFKARGPDFVKSLPAMREEWQRRVSEQLEQAGHKTVIFSAEDISAPFQQNAVSRMRDFFARWSDDVTVIGFVRPPAGFMASAFQQYLKGGTIAEVNQGGLSPHYRARFERVDSVFGRANVHLKAFSPDRLLDGDVVQDFARQIGFAPLVDDQVIRTNESLSLEAVALLYVQRKLGQGFVAGFEGAHEANTAFISALGKIGRRKLAFSPLMLAPVLEREREGVAWMEDRLGYELSSPLAANNDAISSLDDLVSIALEQFDSVQQLLGEHAAIVGPATTESLVLGLERLREHYYSKTVGAVSGNPALGARSDSGMKGLSPVSSKTERPHPTEEELRLRRVLASILWHIDHKGDMPSDPVERKAAFELVKHDYHRKAIDLGRRLENNNLKLVELETQARPSSQGPKKITP